MFKEIFEDQLARFIVSDGYKQAKATLKDGHLAGLHRLIEDAATFREDEARAAADEIAQASAATNLMLLTYKTMFVAMAQNMDALLDQVGQQAGRTSAEIEEIKASVLRAAQLA